MEYQENLSKIYQTIERHHSFIIISHVFPDGDCLGSSTALYKLLRNLGKKATLIIQGEIPYQYKFLPAVEKIKKEYTNEDKEEVVLLFLDCADMDRAQFDISTVKPKIKSMINIDHHRNNPDFGDINLVDYKKSATAEMIFDLLYKYYRKQIDDDIAISLYTGMLTDTGRFQYSSTTKEVHKAISFLLNFDVQPSKIASFIYECEPRNRFKLLESALRRIKIIDSKSLIYSYVLKKDFETLALPFSANDGIIEMLRSVEGIDIAALFKQVKKGHYKVSLRSTDNHVDVSRIAQVFGGGGHKKAAAYSCTGSLKENIKKLENEIGKTLEDDGKNKQK